MFLRALPRPLRPSLARRRRGQALLVVPALALIVAPLLPQRAEAAQTLFWVGLRSGLVFYNQTDPNDLERLSTALSSDRWNIPESPVGFEQKGWEIPINLKLGVRVNSNINLWGFYERLPYTLETPLAERLDQLSVKTVRLDLPANVFGLGGDFRLGSKGYGSQLLLGVGIGAFSTDGDDKDQYGYENFRVEASGTFWEVFLAAEFDFSSELGFYPFISFHGNSTSDLTVTQLPGNALIRGGLPEADEVPPFDIDYMGVTVGLSVRFRVYPFDIEGDPEGDPEGDDLY